MFPMLVLPLIALCFSMTLNAQSSDKDLDQVELMKQFVGTWVAEMAEDSTVVWEIIPLGKGYEQNLYWKAKGETYRKDKGLVGFTSDGNIGMYFLWSPRGNLSRDYGKFDSDNKATFERYNIKHTHVNSIFDYDLIAPDKLKMIWKSRGTKESWDDAEVTEWIWTRVKK